jgi:hypothetical protein
MTFDSPKDIAQRLNQAWMAFPDKDVRFVLVHHDEWDRCTKLTREAAEEITKLRRRCEMEASHIAELKEQIKTLRTERDEARRWFCQHVELSLGGDGTRVAGGHGWDCFKNKTPVTDSRSANAALDRLSQLDEECGLG